MGKVAPLLLHGEGKPCHKNGSQYRLNVRTLTDLLNVAPAQAKAIFCPKRNHDYLRIAPPAGEQPGGKPVRARYPTGAMRVAKVLPNDCPSGSFLAASCGHPRALSNQAYKYEEFGLYLEDTKRQTSAGCRPKARMSARPGRHSIDAFRVYAVLDSQGNVSMDGRRVAVLERSRARTICAVLHTSGNHGACPARSAQAQDLAVSTVNIVDTYISLRRTFTVCDAAVPCHGRVASPAVDSLSRGAVVCRKISTRFVRKTVSEHARRGTAGVPRSITSVAR